MGLNGFQVKLSGFGMTGPMNDHDETGTLRTQGGTNSYMAPEVFESKNKQEESNYDPKKADIYSLAVALFAMLLPQQQPFIIYLKDKQRYDVQGSDKNRLYLYIAVKKPEYTKQFWDWHEKYYQNKRGIPL